MYFKLSDANVINFQKDFESMDCDVLSYLAELPELRYGYGRIRRRLSLPKMLAILSAILAVFVSVLAYHYGQHVLALFLGASAIADVPLVYGLTSNSVRTDLYNRLRILKDLNPNVWAVHSVGFVAEKDGRFYVVSRTWMLLAEGEVLERKRLRFFTTRKIDPLIPSLSWMFGRRGEGSSVGVALSILSMLGALKRGRLKKIGDVLAFETEGEFYVPSPSENEFLLIRGRKILIFGNLRMLDPKEFQ